MRHFSCFIPLSPLRAGWHIRPSPEFHGPVPMFSCCPSFFSQLIFFRSLLVFIFFSFRLVSTSLLTLGWKLVAFYIHVQSTAISLIFFTLLFVLWDCLNVQEFLNLLNFCHTMGNNIPNYPFIPIFGLDPDPSFRNIEIIILSS